MQTKGKPFLTTEKNFQRQIIPVRATAGLRTTSSERECPRQGMSDMNFRTSKKPTPSALIKHNENPR